MAKRAATSNKATSQTSRSHEQVIADYRMANRSREASYLGRKEVLTGKAKFGIFGDGKELAQLAMASVFRHGDFRAGYYRDQTFMFATGMSDVQKFFAQLYAHTNVEAEPASAGRSMNGHFGTRSLNDDGTWKEISKMYNSSSDVSPTASQMPRLVGLGYASRLYRELEDLHALTQFSNKGNEVAFGTIGNASAAEGMFWEAINAIGVLKAPVIMSIWDDGYGISVSNEFQHTKGDVGALIEGFRREKDGSGFEIFKVKGWDYSALMDTYARAEKFAREEHIPVLIHVVEITQPQGHSTSGSHERYKSPERLQWEQDFCCLRKMEEWMIADKIASSEQIEEWKKEDKKLVRESKQAAWDAFTASIQSDIQQSVSLLNALASSSSKGATIAPLAKEIQQLREPVRSDFLPLLHKALRTTIGEHSDQRNAIEAFVKDVRERCEDAYSSHLHSESAERAAVVEEVKPVFTESSKRMNGFEILQHCFDFHFGNDPRVIAFGEDLGMGDVNQGMKDMQPKYGDLRVSDTGIRECTIMGQAIGMAMRGLRPIAEIQYLDYVLYALQLMSDDLASLQYRTKGGQKAPVIVRTRGHRLEGIWHSGSPMGGVINLVRGMHVLVPRNMVQAMGFYNTLMKSDEPGMIVEVLNGYRLKETLPDNYTEYTLPLGVPEVLREGTDCTLVTYGACCRIAQVAADMLAEHGISLEIVDVQSLLPFDVNHSIVESLKKTNRIVFMDEDVPGGASAFMLQQVLEVQKGYFHLDSEPVTLTAKPHRPAYGSDGNYFSKPSSEDVFDAVYNLMNEASPEAYPQF